MRKPFKTDFRAWQLKDANAELARANQEGDAQAEQITKLEAENVRLKEENANLQSERSKVTDSNDQVLEQFRADFAAQGEQLAAAVKAKEAAETKVKEVESSVETRAAKRAQEIVAEVGVKNPITGNSSGANPAAPAKKELTGLARVEAAIAAEIKGK